MVGHKPARAGHTWGDVEESGRGVLREFSTIQPRDLSIPANPLAVAVTISLPEEVMLELMACAVIVQTQTDQDKTPN